MSSFNLLSIGTQALQANANALSVVGQNIANVNTPGYSMQRADLVSLESPGGVQVRDIQRMANDFLTGQINSDTSAYNSAQAFEQLANQLDNLLASDVSSISKSMDDYFAALQGAVDDPSNLADRELLLAQADALVRRFHDLDASLARQQDTISGQIESSVAQINSLGQGLAQINDRVRLATASGASTNELLDERDRLMESLAGYIGFTTVAEANGEMSVFIGNGEPLVVGSNASRLLTVQDSLDPSQRNIALQVGSSIRDVTGQVSGGQIGGLLEYRTDVLYQTQDEMGRIAMVFASSMNAQQLQGLDLDGNVGQRLFADINASAAATDRVLADSGNARSATSRVDIADAGALRASAYELVFNTDSSFTVTRLSDGVRWNSNQLSSESGAAGVDANQEFYFDAASGSLTLQVDGFRLELDSSERFVKGDKFEIQPTRSGASEFALELSSGRALALADSAGGVSNNRNALAMSDLQFAKLVDGSSYQEQYGRQIERVGSLTATAQISTQSSKAVLDANLQTKSSLTGVNLDEEAARLVQFQQAYQASARLIAASQTIFDSLLAVV
ncbi:flagellar hook-associated protein FlgK [Marinobacterium sedimentorum]|uniref:flagellar hook-associated protein FlgK n=1 Tax=Marinobacterium sedimentorum TaxID=2927804 RepID=UPI0020C64763|nr:flagellar hook-associated protein FlgK [Marinobacterium sedimentorum]MCP8687552.1 flagellar hook-associated protein FlgK [Marinobacterium sedimentorum]